MEGKWKERQVPGPCLRTEEIMEHEIDSDTKFNWYTRNSLQKTGTRTGGLWNKSTSGEHPNYFIIEIG